MPARPFCRAGMAENGKPFVTEGDVAAAKVARSRAGMKALRAARAKDPVALKAANDKRAEGMRFKRASRRNIIACYAAVTRDFWLSDCPKPGKRAERLRAAYTIKLTRFGLLDDAHIIDDACISVLTLAKTQARAGIAAFIADVSLWPSDHDMPHVLASIALIAPYVRKAADLGGVSPSLLFSVQTMIKGELIAALSLALQAKRAAAAAAAVAARAARVADAAAYYAARYGVAAPSGAPMRLTDTPQYKAFHHAMSFTSRSSEWKAMYYLLTRDSCEVDYLGSRAHRESVLMEDQPPPYTVPMHLVGVGGMHPNILFGCFLFEETVRGVEKGYIL